MTVSIPVPGRGWLIMPLQELPPPGPPWPMLIGYMALIIAGATAVALFAAAKISRPLVMLEQAITSIGPDGNLPALPETGPDEVQATARALNRLSARLKTADGKPYAAGRRRRPRPPHADDPASPARRIPARRGTRPVA